MSGKHQQILNDRQLEILYTLATKGEQTKSQLCVDFNVKYPAIVGSTSILVEKDLIEMVKTEKGVGKPKLFYGITNKGLEFLSKDSRITLWKFWEVAFFIYEKKTNPKVTFPIESYFTNYEKEVLNYNLNYTPLKWGVILDSFNLLYPKPAKPSYEIAILHTLGIHGLLTEDEIVSKIKKTKFANILNNTVKHNDILTNMIRNKIIIKVMKRNKITYRNSIVGFLILMNYLDSSLSDTLAARQHDDFSSEVKQIIENAYIIPMISANWIKLREMINELNIVQFFRFMTNNSLPLSDSIQHHGVKELIVVERIMCQTSRQTISRECRIGLEVLARLFKDTKIHANESVVFSRLIFLEILSGFTSDEPEKFIKLVKGDKFSLDENVEQSLANIVCFEFFTYFIDWIIGEKSMARSPVENDQIGKWHYSFVEKWNQFQKQNSDFRKWYNSWINEIKNFEEKNLRILKEENFLIV